mmetsp:Transcript_25285/g.34832  ORF Transcript_25285/g.34832 Transcript_25285/m.34832 type:complete len:85 (+) Transcript_25285:1-255(+)
MRERYTETVAPQHSLPDGDSSLVPGGADSSTPDVPSLVVDKGLDMKSDLPHIHSFPEDLQNFNEETGVTRKKCLCGFVVEVEEL